MCNTEKPDAHWSVCRGRRWQSKPEFSPRPVSLIDLCFYLIFLIVLIRGSPHGGGDVGIFICSDVSSLCLPIGVAS